MEGKREANRKREETHLFLSDEAAVAYVGAAVREVGLDVKGAQD